MTKTINILSMIIKHIISIEFGSNSFNATCDINKKTHSLKEKYLWIEMFKMNDIMVKKTQNTTNWVTICWAYLIFEFLYLHLYYLWCIFLMIECSFDVIHIFVFSYMMCNMLQLDMGLR